MNFSCLKKQASAVFSYRGWVLCLAMALVGWANAPTAHAQQKSAMSAVYGRGVHAYFAGNTTLAEQYFSQVIQAGSSDPRPYYYRAVLRLGQGRQFEAENDMRVGAAHEARNPGTQHAIGRALQRVQGTGRRTLEKFRRQARLDRLQQNQQQTRQRYEQLDQRGPTVIRNANPLPLEYPVQPPQQLAVPGQAPMLHVPQQAAPVPSQPMPAGSDTKPAGSGTKDDAADPFGTPAPVTPAPVTPADDPFGSATKPAPIPTPAPEPAPTPAAEADPFGGELPSPATEEADPFGESPAPAEEESTPPEMTDDDPFGASPAEDDSAAPAETDEAETDEADPFGESEEAMESEAPAESAPSEEEEDPFGDAEESSSEEDDPFGDAEESTSEPADDSDPFGEETMEEETDEESEPAEESSDSAEEAPADDESPAPEEDEDDPFGGFGAVSPRPTGEAFAETGRTNATDPAIAAPAGQLFFALGQWLGSRGNLAAPSGAVRADAVVQAGFELGPAEGNRAAPATAELSTEDDPFAEAAFEDDSDAAGESPDDEDDLFGDF